MGQCKLLIALFSGVFRKLHFSDGKEVNEWNGYVETIRDSWWLVLRMVKNFENGALYPLAVVYPIALLNYIRDAKCLDSPGIFRRDRRD